MKFFNYLTILSIVALVILGFISQEASGLPSPGHHKGWHKHKHHKGWHKGHGHGHKHHKGHKKHHKGWHH
ncbi:UNVERIFIED_CONTAM: hypothetical protein RMT77_006939 [Armadillidium vulgare]